MAPLAGVSLYTWTTIIGVVLAGISLGNYLGGRLADRAASNRTLGTLLYLSGLASLVLLPLVAGGEVTDAFPQNLPLIPTIVLLAVMLFFLPSLLMGMVSPMVVKLTLKSLSTSGNVVGTIYAWSTLGAILGTFATGLVLVGHFGTRAVVLGIGVALMGLGLICGNFLRSAGSMAVLAVPIAFMVMVLIRSDGLNAGCLRETDYYCIDIQEERLRGTLVKILKLDLLAHNYTAVDDPTYLHYPYMKIFGELTEYVARLRPDFRALMIGGGAYTLPRYAEVVYPAAQMEVVEIDPVVTDIAYQELGLPRSDRIVTHNLDGRQMVDTLLASGQKYDLVLVDVFHDIALPFHLTTSEFDAKVRGLLHQDGLYLVVVVDKLRGGIFLPSCVRTMRQVFPHVYVLAEGAPWRRRGQDLTFEPFVIAGSMAPLDSERLAAVRGQGSGGLRASDVMDAADMDAWLRSAGGVVLTDDYAPVDNLMAARFLERLGR